MADQMTELDALKTLVEHYSHLPKHKGDAASKKITMALRILRKTIKTVDKGDVVQASLSTLRENFTPAVLVKDLEPIYGVLKVATQYFEQGGAEQGMSALTDARLVLNGLIQDAKVESSEQEE